MSDKNLKQKIEKEYVDLFYMTSMEVSAKDIAELFQNTAGITVQLWEEMNVLELELPSENSIDFEPLEPSFKEPGDAAFIKNRNIKTIFALNLCEADLQGAIPYFEQITQKYSGFVCMDSQDFKPVYSGDAKRTI